MPRRYKDHPFRARGWWAGESSRCEDQKTTQHAASLRPSGNGRIRFKPPYSKRGNPPKAPYGLNLYRPLPLLAGREVSIMRFDLSKTITTRHAASLRSSQCEDSPTPRHHRRIPSIPSHGSCRAQRLPIHSVASRMWIVSDSPSEKRGFCSEDEGEVTRPIRVHVGSYSVVAQEVDIAYWERLGYG